MSSPWLSNLSSLPPTLHTTGLVGSASRLSGDDIRAKWQKLQDPQDLGHDMSTDLLDQLEDDLRVKLLAGSLNGHLLGMVHQSHSGAVRASAASRPPHPSAADDDLLFFGTGVPPPRLPGQARFVTGLLISIRHGCRAVRVETDIGPA